MARRYLFGPVSGDFARNHLLRQREAGECLAFDLAGTTDLAIAPTDSWEAVVSKLPAGWQPDFIALYLQYTTIPECLWSAPVPIVALAGDWNLLWHTYRSRLKSCDLVLIDPAGVETLTHEGITHARPANLFGGARSLLDAEWPEVPRDIDILFVGNMHPAVQRERLPWLGRLAKLADRYNVVIRTAVHGAPYRELLGRARIVFNRSIRGECNLRVIEAAAAGALLFQEAENREVPRYFERGKEYVPCTDQDLESLLLHYLEHEAERQTIAEAARKKVRRYSFENLWQELVDTTIAAEWSSLVEQSRQRPALAGKDALLARTWQMLTSTHAADIRLEADLTQALQADPRQTVLYNALGVIAPRLTRGPLTAATAEKSAACFQRALREEPTNLVAALNLVECLVALDQNQPAIDLARAALGVLDGSHLLDADILASAHFSVSYNYFQVEWERAAWSNAVRPREEALAKRQLIRWRLNFILAELTGELHYYYEAVLARPDLPISQAMLGCALGRAKRPAEAAAHLGQAISSNPFDSDAARALYSALGEAGEQERQQVMARDRRLLARAAPQLVPAEDWFSSKPRFEPVSLEELHRLYGQVDTSRALTGFTNRQDTHAVLTLLAHARPKRILEIGTAFGHMTANLTEWSPEEAQVFTLGITTDLPASTPAVQQYETPAPQKSGAYANHFGKGRKVQFITADSLTFDFGSVAPLDFAFIDGAHDEPHVLSDTLKVYENLQPGGFMVWHDFGSKTPWVEVRQALERIRFSESIYHVAGTQVAFLQKSRTAVPGPSVAPRPPVDLGGIVWEGAVEEVASLALVNRELCQGLIRRGHDVSIRVPASQNLDVPRLAVPTSLRERIGRPTAKPVNAHVRHAWPPSFQPPPEGHWVIIQPWEFGSLPKSWIGHLSHEVDEIWAYTSFVRDCYVQSGVPAERVQVVPLGVDPGRYHPDAKPFPLPTKKRFKFLYVGGTIYRKGIDLLLKAYTQAFRAQDDVCLVVKDMGAGTFYRGQTAEQQVAEYRAKENCPEIAYLDRPLTDEELAGLYTACDCFVLPYRGEGFGLPIAEAMACGLPVVVTGLGAARDFCNEANAFLIPASIKRFAEKRVGDLETVDYPWLAEANVEALQELLRYVVEHPDQAKAKGRAASAHIRSHWTWDQATAAIERRLAALRQQPIRRLQGRSSPPPPALTGPAIVVSAVPQAQRQRVSLCMIVKNEEANLPECLGGLSDLFDEMVVIDTGSTDRTKKVATRLGAKVFEFPWVDSFAAARNESVQHATGDWIFWLDGDDRLDAANRQNLKALFAELKPGEIVGYSMKCVCLPDPINNAVTVVDHIRLFPNHPQVRWSYRVHEQILPSIRRLGGQVRWADVVIQHTGYQDPALRGKKLQRDLRLLHLEDQEHPDDPFTLFNLGSVYQELGKVAEAIPLLRRSLERSNPGDSIVRKLYALIAQSHRHLDQFQEALTACVEGRRYYPQDTELLFQESIIRRDLGDACGAEACLLQLLGSQEGAHFASVDAGLRGHKARHNLAIIYQEQGRLAEAEAQWKAALADHRGFTPAWLGLAEVALTQGRLDEAAAIYRDLLRHQPQEAYHHTKLGQVLWQQGRLSEAIAALREAIRLQPTYAAAHSSLLICLNYDPNIYATELFEEHRRWEALHAQVPRVGPAPDHDQSPNRRLRIGYVSPDLRRHVVARFLEPILGNHDPERVEVFCYSDVTAPDTFTQRLQSVVAHWRAIAGKPDGQVAEMIQADRIDILVDLAGHTGNRLGVFARKPAPIQVSYLGYPNTTGLTTIDYRLTDALAAPPGEPALYTEDLIRLPKGFCCYAPPAGLPEPGPLPAAAARFVTFGSLHHLGKLNLAVLDLWSEVLRAVPKARLLVARHTLSGSAVEYFQQQFVQRGIEPNRLLLQQAPTDGRHWELYQHIDISLDTFPWSGHTTACESLWSGVPVVTLAGNRHAGRMVASVLRLVGLGDFVAGNREAFVATATKLAGNLDQLAALRKGLRAKMQQSPLCDGKTFTRQLEEAYRTMWQRWVDQK